MKRLPNDLIHIFSLLLWFVCASTLVMALATAWAGFAAESFVEQAKAKGGAVDALSGWQSLFVWSIASAMISVVTGISAWVLWAAGQAAAKHTESAQTESDAAS